MSTNSNPATPRQLEVDAVADIIDQFYLNVNEEAGSMEYVSAPAKRHRPTELTPPVGDREQEDVWLYNLYDHHTPQPCLKSPRPNLKPDSLFNKPIDQEMLAKKLRNYMESASHGNKPDHRYDMHGLSDCTGKGPTLSVGVSETARGGRWFRPNLGREADRLAQKLSH